ncbi:MAG: hypothetical protein P4L56_16455 [Candidatus Sulfopaludibacter sp.]|nr:hypothetical protein [Candidatus Sulfopaludibacter sp.]
MIRNYCLLTCVLASLWGEPVAVRHLEGVVHGFLVLRTLDGALVADGESLQVAKGDRVTNRLVFRFKDGSVQDETAVFSQRGHFRLLSDHLVQKGPVFKHPMDVSVDGLTGMVTVRAGDKTETTHLDLPPDLANGMVPVLLKNLGPGSQPAELSMFVATPKPLLVKLLITAQGEDSFVTGGASHKATRYNIKVDIGGLRGVVAPLVGKQPPDTQVWILPGSFPTFLKSEGPLFEGGPTWRTELVSPAWPANSASSR